MKDKKLDRRIVKTQEAIQKSLIPLILKKGYDAVTIQDVLDHANVGRSTFYAHFRDKEDLLSSGFDVLMNELTEYVKKESLQNTSGSTKARFKFKFALPLLEHANENRALFKALLGNRGGVIMQKRAYEMIVELTKTELLEAGFISKTNSLGAGFKTHFYAGSFFLY